MLITHLKTTSPPFQGL